MNIIPAFDEPARTQRGPYFNKLAQKGAPTLMYPHPRGSLL